MIRDLLAAMVAHLRAQPGIVALVGDRVFGVELPAGETAHMPRSALVLTPSGGTVTEYARALPLDSLRVDAWCYGVTPHEAQRLRRAVRAALRSMTRVQVGAVLFHWAQPAGGYSTGRDPDTRWPRVWESYTVLASET